MESFCGFLKFFRVELMVKSVISVCQFQFTHSWDFYRDCKREFPSLPRMLGWGLFFPPSDTWCNIQTYGDVFLRKYIFTRYRKYLWVAIIILEYIQGSQFPEYVLASDIANKYRPGSGILNMVITETQKNLRQLQFPFGIIIHMTLFRSLFTLLLHICYIFSAWNKCKYAYIILYDLKLNKKKSIVPQLSGKKELSSYKWKHWCPQSEECV